MSRVYVFLYMWINFHDVLSRRCPVNWYEGIDIDSCYRFWPTRLKSWKEARATCQQYGGDLLKLKSKQETTWILQEVVKYPASYEWWIGLQRHPGDDTLWLWTDGTPRNESSPYISWGSGEPNNYMDSEDCGEIWDNLLNDKNCDYPLQFICERPKDLPMKCDVDDGWDDVIDNQCLKHFNKKVTYTEALSMCTTYDATLLKVKDENEQKKITDFLDMESTPVVWLAYQADTSAKSWSVAGDSTGGITYNAWEDGDTDFERIAANDTFCSILDTNGTKYQNWKPSKCDEAMASTICMKDQGICPEGYIQHKTTCYLLNTQDFMIWNEAKGFCNLRQTSLLEILNDDDWFFVTNLLLQRYSISSINTVWLGLSGTKDGQWEWLSGEALDPARKDLITETKSIPIDGVRCGYFDTLDNQWKVSVCNEEGGAVCMIPVNKNVVTPPPQKPRYECPESYVLHGVVCYRRDPGFPLDWYSAQAKCKQEGADLVFIITKEDNNFLADLIKDETWIGLSDRDKEGSFRWPDNSAQPTYTNWFPEQPDNVEIGLLYSENCVAMHYGPGQTEHGKWIDYPCSFKRHFVCQLPAEWNIALGKIATQSSTVFAANLAIDGCDVHSIRNGVGCCAQTRLETSPWWQLDFGTQYPVGKIVITRRAQESCEDCLGMINGFRVFVSNSSGSNVSEDLVYEAAKGKVPAQIKITLTNVTSARYIRIDVSSREASLAICEVQIISDVQQSALSPDETHCITDSTQWMGKISNTISGKTCQDWVRNIPHTHSYHDKTFPDGTEVEAKNYCRDPLGEGQPWCYTLDPSTRWEFCAVPHCDAEYLTDKERSEGQTQSDCDPGWVEDPENGHCYWLSDSSLTWSDAQSVCQSMGAHLPHLANPVDAKFLSVQLSKNQLDAKFWIGQYYAVDKQAWVFTDGLPSHSDALISGDKPNRIFSCIALDKKATFGARSCMERLVFSCVKTGAYIQYRTSSNEEPRDVPMSLVKQDKQSEVKTFSLTLEFKGYDGATIFLKNPQNKGFIIRIGGNLFEKSSITREGSSSPEHTALLPKLCSETEFKPFWIKWTEANTNGDSLSVGRGNDVGRNVFLTWAGGKDGAFKVSAIDVATVVKVSKVYGGIWRFKKDLGDTQMKTSDINLALNKPARQSSTYVGHSGPEKAVDGCSKNFFSGQCLSHTNKDFNPWWEVDLEHVYSIREIVVHRRWDCCRERLAYFRVFVSMFSDSTVEEDVVYRNQESQPPEFTYIQAHGKYGRYVKIDIPGREEYLELTEVQVFQDMDASRCGQGWIDMPDNGICYKFSDVAMQWAHAKDLCQSLDASMAIPKSPQEQLFMYESLLPIPAVDVSRSVWLGASDLTSEGTFKTVDSSDLLYTDWGKGEPNNLGDEDCVGLRIFAGKKSGRWNDFPCSTSLLAVCTKSENPTTTTTTAATTKLTTTITTTVTTQKLTTAITLIQGECKENWLYSTSSKSCLRIFEKTGLTFYGAGRKCIDIGARLADIPSVAEQRVISELIRKKGLTGSNWDSLWVAAIDEHSEGNWHWLMSNVTWSPIVWRPGQPDNSGGMEDCAMVLLSETYLGLLNDATCDKPGFDFMKGYVCKYSLEPTECSDGWVDNKESGACYWYSKEKVAAWEDAKKYCSLAGGNLASFSSATEQLFLRVLTTDTTTKPAWTGARLNTQELAWEWIDRTMWSEDVQVEPFSFEYWDTWDESKNCGLIGLKPGGSGYVIFRYDCSRQQSYICKRKYGAKAVPSSTAPTKAVPSSTATVFSTGSPLTTTQSDSASKCGVGWDVGPGKVCFKFIIELATWSDAQNKCQQEGGNLVSIGSDKDQSYVTGRLQGISDLPEALWIGASDIEQEAGWTWTDGQPFVYVNWAPTEPNDYFTPGSASTGEDCAALSTENKQYFGQWNDLPCATTLGYICTKIAYSEVTTPITTTVNPAMEETEYVEFYQHEEGTKPDFQSHDLYEMGVRQTGSFRFSVKTKHDAHILLQKERGNYDSTDNYLVIIGGWGNKKSIIEGVQQGNTVYNEDYGLLSKYEYRSFWITWTEKKISVGKTSKLGQDVFLTLEGNIGQINYVSVGTAQWTDAWWKIPKGSKVFGCEGKGWLSYKNSCFLVVEKIGDWDEANGYCRKEGGELASISDTGEQDFVFSQLPTNSYCNNIYGNDSLCSTWAERGECNRNPVWMATHCHKACNLCMHNCRDLHRPSRHCMTWAKMGECDKNPKWMIPKCALSCGVCAGAPNRGFWIGMKRSGSGRTYAWSDNKFATYSNWEAHFPRAFGFKHGSCVAMFLQNGKWNDGNCDEQLPGFVCKQPKILLPVTSVSPFKTGCDKEGSFGYGSYCYIYVKEERSWKGAQANCAMLGGSLVYIEEKYTQAFVDSELQNSLQDHWIGLLVTDRVFKWDGRRNSELNFEHFERSFKADTIEDGCFAMTTSKPAGFWKLYTDCTLKLPSVCQLPRKGYTTPQTPTTVQATKMPPQCPDGWFLSQDQRKCYYLSSKKLTQFEASQKCLEVGASLGHIDSLVENSRISDIARSREGARYWLGFQDYIIEGVFMWEGIPVLFTNWDTNQPNNAGDQDCVVVNTDTQKWDDVDCGEQNQYICEIRSDESLSQELVEEDTAFPACNESNPDGWIRFEDYCYLLRNDGVKTWHEADESCKSFGSQLSSVHSFNESEFMFILMAQTGTSAVWIGFNDLDLDGMFEWSDGTLVDYTSWDSGQPNDINGGEKCTLLLYRVWHDYPCSDIKDYVCKKRHSTVVESTTAAVVPTVTGGCPQGFNYTWGNKCYFFSGADDLLSWGESVDECKRIGGYIVSVHGEEEQAFITANIYGVEKGMWIGFHDLNPSLQFDWSDNSPVDFTWWAPYEPSNQGSYRKEPCVEILVNEENFGKWNDVHCYAQRGYICSALKDAERPKVEPPCPEDYILIKDSCYKLTESKIAWAESQKLCATDNGTFASVRHPMSDHYVILFIYKRYGQQSFWLPRQQPPQHEGYYDCPYFDGTYTDSCEGRRAALCQITLGGEASKTTKMTTSLSRKTTTTYETSVSGGGQQTTTQSQLFTKREGFPPAHGAARLEKLEPEGGLTGGQIAGVVIGTLGCLLIAAAVLYMVKAKVFKKPLFDIQQQSLGFDNALFQKSQESVALE